MRSYLHELRDMLPFRNVSGDARMRQIARAEIRHLIGELRGQRARLEETARRFR